MFKKLWFGVYSLPVAFWGFCVLGNVAVILLASIIGLLSAHAGLAAIGIPVALLGVWGYWIVASVGVWKSAEAYPFTRFWPLMAKGIVLFYWVAFLYRAANGGLEQLMALI